MPVIKQLLKEFWLPVLVAIAWTIYNVNSAPKVQTTLKDAINIFGPTFFFASWLIAQWYRVKKQQKVEQGLVGIESKIQKNLDDLDKKTQDLVSYITGGASACYLVMSQISTDRIGSLVLVHVGDHPLYEINARIVDLEIFDQTKDNMTPESLRASETVISFGNLTVGHALMTSHQFNLGTTSPRRFNIFFSARNGSFTQLLRFARVDGKWIHAIKVMRDETVLYESVQPEYPKGAGGQVAWDA